MQTFVQKTQQYPVARNISGEMLVAYNDAMIMGILTLLHMDPLFYFSVAAIVCAQVTFFGFFALAFARQLRLRAACGFAEKLLRLGFREAALTMGITLVAAGLAGAIYGVFDWELGSFGALIPSEFVRTTSPSVTLIVIGTQLVFGAFLLGFIEIEGRDSLAEITTS